ncbi:hypothetical protein ACH5RR_004424 [Cinchona calisaya]|uniref:Uncharacterized protein n=1 Tax=Cinchona calisaya TaxID=153742 RepID=A0ABD3AXX0_9GENT
MCATAVLRSYDCLRKPYYTRRKSNHNNNPNVSGSRRRKRSPTRFESNVHDRSRGVANNNQSDLRKSTTSTSVVAPAAATASGGKSNLVMGQVKILKRGDPMPDNCNYDYNKKAADPIPIPTPTPTTAFRKLGFVGSRDEDDLILCSTGRLGPEPEMVQKQIRASDFYAGSGPTVASPPPSSLPFPAFFSKKEKKIDEATNNLLRLLRLDLA